MTLAITKKHALAEILARPFQHHAAATLVERQVGRDILRAERDAKHKPRMPGGDYAGHQQARAYTGKGAAIRRTVAAIKAAPRREAPFYARTLGISITCFRQRIFAARMRGAHIMSERGSGLKWVYWVAK